MKSPRAKISNNKFNNRKCNNSKRIKINKTTEVDRHNNRRDLNRKRIDPHQLKVVEYLNNQVIKNLFTIMFKVLKTKPRVSKFKRNNKIKHNNNLLRGSIVHSNNNNQANKKEALRKNVCYQIITIIKFIISNMLKIIINMVLIKEISSNNSPKVFKNLLFNNKNLLFQFSNNNKIFKSLQLVKTAPVNIEEKIKNFMKF